MTPEKALDILEGRIPHKEPFHSTLTEKYAPTSKPLPTNTKMNDGVTLNTNQEFVKILGIVFILGVLISVHLWRMDAESKVFYKKGFNEGVTSTSVTSKQEEIRGEREQIKNLQDDLNKSKANTVLLQKELDDIKSKLASEIGKKEYLSESLKVAQASIPARVRSVERNLQEKIKALMEDSQKTISKTEQGRDQALEKNAEEEKQLAVEQNEIKSKDQEIDKLRRILSNPNGKAEQALVSTPVEISAHPDSFSDYINQGLAYEQEHNYDKAIADFNKVIEMAPGSLQAYSARGMVYEAKGYYKEAITDLNKALKINPRYSLCFYRLGDIYYLKGNYSAALANWNKALKLDSQNDGSHITYYRKGNPDRIISENTNVIKVYPGYTMAYYMRGAAFGAKGQHEKAIADLSRAIALNPKYLEAYNDRAVAYFLKHDYNKALEDVIKVQELGGAVNADFVNSLKTVLGNAEGSIL